MAGDLCEDYEVKMNPLDTLERLRQATEKPKIKAAEGKELAAVVKACCAQNYPCARWRTCKYLDDIVSERCPLDREDGYMNPARSYKNDEPWIPQAHLSREMRLTIGV